MHELLLDLLPWLAGFLLLDGVFDLRRGHLLLASAGGRLQLRRSGLHLLWPLPTAEAVLVEDLPWLATGRALHLVEPGRRGELRVVEPCDLEPVAWEGLAPRAEGKRVTAGDRLLLLAPHPSVASSLAAALGHGAPARPDDGEAARRDFEAARALRARQLPWRWPLLLLASALWGGLFLAGGAVALAPELGPGAGLLLAALLGLLLAEAALAGVMLRACGQPWGRVLAGAGGLVAWPVAALRPLGALSTPLYARLDGLAVAAALAPDAFRRHAALELGRAEASRLACGAALAPAWEGRERRLEALLEACGGTAAEARRPPVRLPGEASWCPVCRSGYRAGPARCADCGTALRPHAGAVEAAGPSAATR